jgi:hypothetical protein
MAEKRARGGSAMDRETFTETIRAFRNRTPSGHSRS